jgi:hypothetical protein
MKNLISMKGLGTLGVILVVILLIALFGSYPGWQHSHSWGYAPFGGVGIILLILIILLVLGKL